MPSKLPSDIQVDTKKVRGDMIRTSYRTFRFLFPQVGYTYVLARSTYRTRVSRTTQSILCLGQSHYWKRLSEKIPEQLLPILPELRFSLPAIPFQGRFPMIGVSQIRLHSSTQEIASRFSAMTLSAVKDSTHSTVEDKMHCDLCIAVYCIYDTCAATASSYDALHLRKHRVGISI